MKTTRREIIQMLGVAAGTVVITPLFSRGVSVAKEPIKPVDFPWPYSKLDPDVSADISYKGYEVGRCMYGTFLGIIGRLAEEKGAPYNTFPFLMMKYGKGGVADWATLCGALNGAAAAIYLVSNKPEPIVDELFGWFQQEKLPIYQPKDSKLEIVPSVARSTLCHVSVSRWCKVSKFKAFSKEREERCARLTADVTKKTAELLNQQLASTFKPVYPIPDHVKQCRACHDKGGTLENTRGKMDCSPCHFNLGTAHKKI
jgi:hypothetical protein